MLVRLCLERPKRHFCERFALASEREAKAKVSVGHLEAQLGKNKTCFGVSRQTLARHKHFSRVEEDLGKTKLFCAVEVDLVKSIDVGLLSGSP